MNRLKVRVSSPYVENFFHKIIKEKCISKLLTTIMKCLKSIKISVERKMSKDYGSVAHLVWLIVYFRLELLAFKKVFVKIVYFSGWASSFELLSLKNVTQVSYLAHVTNVLVSLDEKQTLRIQTTIVCYTLLLIPSL